MPKFTLVPLCAKPSPLDSRLVAYSALAGAMLSATSARAAITLIDSSNLVFDGTSVSPSDPPAFIVPGSPYSANFHVDPQPNFSFAGFKSGGWAKIGGGIAFSGTFSYPYALKLSPGAKVSSFSQFASNRVFLARLKYGSQPEGNFGAGNGTGYVGFKFHASSKSYFGWLNVKVQFNGSDQPTIVSLIPKTGTTDVYGAYAPASDAITAGETAVPEPSVNALCGLALLSLGAAGVRELRRRRAEA